MEGSFNFGPPLHLGNIPKRPLKDMPKNDFSHRIELEQPSLQEHWQARDLDRLKTGTEVHVENDRLKGAVLDSGDQLEYSLKQQTSMLDDICELLRRSRLENEKFTAETTESLSLETSALVANARKLTLDLDQIEVELDMEFHEATSTEKRLKSSCTKDSFASELDSAANAVITKLPVHLKAAQQLNQNYNMARDTIKQLNVINEGIQSASNMSSTNVAIDSKTACDICTSLYMLTASLSALNDQMNCSPMIESLLNGIMNNAHNINNYFNQSAVEPASLSSVVSKSSTVISTEEQTYGTAPTSIRSKISLLNKPIIQLSPMSSQMSFATAPSYTDERSESVSLDSYRFSDYSKEAANEPSNESDTNVSLSNQNPKEVSSSTLGEDLLSSPVSADFFDNDFEVVKLATLRQEMDAVSCDNGRGGGLYSTLLTALEKTASACGVHITNLMSEADTTQESMSQEF